MTINKTLQEVTKNLQQTIRNGEEKLKGAKALAKEEEVDFYLSKDVPSRYNSRLAKSLVGSEELGERVKKYQKNLKPISRDKLLVAVNLMDENSLRHYYQAEKGVMQFSKKKQKPLSSAVESTLGYLNSWGDRVGEIMGNNSDDDYILFHVLEGAGGGAITGAILATGLGPTIGYGILGAIGGLLTGALVLSWAQPLALKALYYPTKGLASVVEGTYYAINNTIEKLAFPKKVKKYAQACNDALLSYGYSSKPKDTTDIIQSIEHNHDASVNMLEMFSSYAITGK